MQILEIKQAIVNIFLFVRQLHLNSLRETLHIMKRILVIGSQCVNKQS